MKKVILIFVTIVLSGLLYAKDNKSTDALLREIDGIIKNRQTYGAEKEARIADLKKLLAEATSDEQRYGFCGRLFDEYRAYNLDSSFVYAQRKEELAHRMDKLDYLDDAAMNMAEVMGTTGMYKEALELLGQIDKKTLPDYLYGYYYHLYRTIYGLMGDYAVTEKVKKEYYRMTDLYRDSLLQVNASDSLGHVLVMADKCIVHAQYDEAIRMLMEYYNKPSLDDHSKAMLTYTLSEGYRLKGDKQGQKHYLALSAIADLKSAVKEYAVRAEAVMAENKAMSKELEELKAKIAASKVDSLFNNAEDADGVKIASAYFTGTTGDTLRGMCDSIRDKAVNPVVAVLVGKAEDKITMAVTVNKLAQEKGLKAGVLVKELAAIAGGKGGGKPDFAMAGLKDETKIDEALAAVGAIVKKALGE